MSDKPKCEKCGDTGFLDCAEPIFCDCEFGLEVAIASAGRSVRERVREAVALLRAQIAALEAAVPTPAETKVLKDIRAATAAGYKAVAFRVVDGGECYLSGNLQVLSLSSHSAFPRIILAPLAPIAPEPQPCPGCSSPVRARSTDNQVWVCECSAVATCCYRSPGASSRARAIEMHNSVSMKPKEAPRG